MLRPLITLFFIASSLFTTTVLAQSHQNNIEAFKTKLNDQLTLNKDEKYSPDVATIYVTMLRLDTRIDEEGFDYYKTSIYVTTVANEDCCLYCMLRDYLDRGAVDIFNCIRDNSCSYDLDLFNGTEDRESKLFEKLFLRKKYATIIYDYNQFSKLYKN
jgi:hypothetical protein